MTVEEQLVYDLHVWGVSVERQLPNGKTERIDPTTIRYKFINDKHKTRDILIKFLKWVGDGYDFDKGDNAKNIVDDFLKENEG